MIKLFLVLTLVFGMVLAGCSSTVHTPNPGPSPLSVSTTAPPAGTVGVAYTTSLTAVNGVQPYSWSVSAGSLPAGLTLTGSTISGTPTASGMANFTVKVTDATNATATANLSITINAGSVSITTATLANATLNSAYSATLQSTGGAAPITWSITAGALPTGLTLNAATGAISGTPTAAGTSNFTVQAADSSAPPLTAAKALSITVVAGTLSVTTTTLPNVVINSAYSATLQSAGGTAPITWSVTAGTLPTGLTLNAATGAISGTPTTAGTLSFTVQAADSSAPPLTATKALSITVIPVLAISSSSLPNGVTNAVYSATLQSSGGVAPVSWSVTVGTLPTGLSLNAATGAITGTPTVAGTSNFTVQATDSGTPSQTVTKALSITIVQQLVISNSTLPAGAVGSVYSATLQSTGGTPAVSWTVTVGTLPAGLALNAATGAISGTPTTAGTSTFTVQATDSGTPQQNPTKQFNIIINPALAITTISPMPSGTVGTAYSQTLATNGGGIAPITWSVTVGALPGGLSLNAATGVISGTPTTATGSPFNFTVQAADSGAPQQTSTKALSISIATASLSVATTSLPDGVVGQSYSGATLQSAGGNPPVTWSISVGALPAGLTLNASTGAITGSPTAAGPTAFTVTATDSTTPTEQTATKQLNIKVNSVLAVTTTSLAGGTVNAPYSATLQSSGGATPITWSVTTGTLPNGLTLNSGTGVISGTPTTAATSNFTVTATDSTSPTAQTASAALSITVSVAPLVITTTTLPSGVVTSSYNQTLQFNGGTNPVTWTITTGALPAGLSLNAATGNISGTPTTVGTSPFTVKATDSTTPTAQTATASLSITINTAACPTGGSLTMLTGQYAFAMEGFDTSGGTFPEGIAGIFDADGAGHIANTVGIYDINDASSFGVASLSISSATSSYTIGTDGRGCLVVGLTGGGGATFRFSLGNVTGGVAYTGHMIQFDSNGGFKTGILRKQDSSAFSNAAVAGNYAFGGTAPKPGPGKYALAGAFTASSGTPNGTISAGQMDVNDNGNVNGSGAAFTYPPTPIAFTGTYNISANGRGTITLTTSTSTINANVYVVSATEMLLMSTDLQSTNPLFVGTALQTTQSTFVPNSLNAPGVVYTTGLGNNGGTAVGRVAAAIFSPNGSGGFTYNGYQNSGGSITANTAPAGLTYSVAANGRVTIVGPSGGSTPLFYLVGPNKGFVLFTDKVGSTPKVESGFLDPQTGSPFTNSSANGPYAFGTMWPSAVNVTQNAGVATFANPNINVTSDAASPAGKSPNATFTSTYSIDSTGLGVIPANCSILGGTCQTIFYVISPTKAVVFNVQSTNTDPDLQVADQ